MPRKPRRSVPEILWRLFGNKARNLKDTIVYLIPNRNIQPEQCRCRGQGCLRCSPDKPSFLLRPDDPIHYRKLLQSCFVGLHERTPPLLDFSPKSWGSQREIVERIVEMMKSGGDFQNVICARYDQYHQSSPILELLTSSSWEFLLNRVGHDFMAYLLKHTSIFLPFLGKKHQQVSGPPLRVKKTERFSVDGNKRKRDDNDQPSNKRQRSEGQPREEKPNKRSRLYLKRRRVGKPSTENEADARNLNIPKQAKQVKTKKPFNNSETLSVIPPKHILKTSRPNCSDSKLLMNHIFGEVNAWSTAPSHGKGNCPTGSICLYHSLLKSLKSLIGKSKSSHLKTLLDKHCPAHLLQEDDALKSADEASQSSSRQNSEKGKTNSPSVEETKLYCTNDQVASFIWAVCRYIVPETMLGTSRQMRVLRKNIAWFVSRRRVVSRRPHEKHIEKQFLHNVKPSEFSFFNRKQLCCIVRGNELQNQCSQGTQHTLCTRWISWLFSEIIEKLVRFNFYATESQGGRLHIYYYRKSSWERLVSEEISKNIDGFEKVDDAEAARRKMLGLSKLRVLPKANGVRLLLDFSYRSTSSSPLSRWSMLKSLCDTHAVLKDIQLKEPNVLGSSVFDHDDFYRSLSSYLIHLRSQPGEFPSLFFVVADVFKAFDSIDHEKLLDVIRSVLKHKYILNRCKLVSRGKRSLWQNDVLVSTDGKASVSRLTSNLPCNALQSILVDQGENHLVRKTDLVSCIEDMVKNNMVQLNKSFYVKKDGIPQGHRLSPLLCCFYYGDMERTLIYPFLEEASRDASTNREKEIITPPSYKLLRFMDDYLFVSTSKDQATRFYRRLKDGFPEYKCSMNEKKFCINFEDEKEESTSSSSRMYVGDNGVPFMRWTGLLINSRTFEIQVDYTRYLSGHISSTFSVAWEKPVRNLGKKLCYFLVPKCHPVLFDSNINSRAIVRLNIYQIFLLAAMKFHCYVYELSRFWKLDPQTLSRFITRSIRYMFRLINRRMHRINTGPSFRPVLKLHKEEVIWLGLHAYIQVLKKKNARYRTILSDLKSALSKRNVSLNLWPDLEYATDRSNSSSLWKLKY